MTTVSKDEAVSPVIGVILMVAITVILAAVIAAFVMGFGSNITQTKVIATTAYQYGTSEILINYLGGTDDPELSSLSIIAPDGYTYITIDNLGTLARSGTPMAIPFKPKVGNVMILTGNLPGQNVTSGRDHVIVTGHFDDGAVQVLLDIFV